MAAVVDGYIKVLRKIIIREELDKRWREIDLSLLLCRQSLFLELIGIIHLDC